ncbi:MAG: hypothetical protein ABSE77_12035 [Acidimicrobiales bacterium]|jgi:hypothetical protein
MSVAANWSLPTNHARMLLCTAQNPEVRLPGIAASVNIIECRAYSSVTDLAEAGYVAKSKEVDTTATHLPLLEAASEDRSIGDVLDLLAGPLGQNGAGRPYERCASHAVEASDGP